MGNRSFCWNRNKQAHFARQEPATGSGQPIRPDAKPDNGALFCDGRERYPDFGTKRSECVPEIVKSEALHPTLLN